jgi:hypothetical protein
LVLRGISFAELITILLRDRLFLTNSSSKLSLIVLSAKKTISYIAIMKKLVKRTANVNINIGFVLFSDVEYLFNPDSAFGLKSLGSKGKEKILAYINSQD